MKIRCSRTILHNFNPEKLQLFSTMNARKSLLLQSLFVFVLCMIPNFAIADDGTPTDVDPSGGVPPIKAPAHRPVSVTQDINELIVAFAQNIGTVTVSVEDESGNIMYETTAFATAGSSLTINTSGWDSGSYVLTVTDSSGTLYEIVVFVP
jgi:hypothetical protein